MSMVSRSGRGRVLMLALPLVVLVSSLLTSCTQGMDTDTLGYINATRASMGLQQLVRNPELDAGAQAKANELVQTQQLVHSANPAAGVNAQWTVFGENLGKGASAQQIFELWMTSQTHHDTMTDGRFNFAGIGVSETPDGTFFIVVRFMAA